MRSRTAATFGSSGSTANAMVSGGKWQVLAFPLTKGDNVIDASIEAKKASVLVVRGSEIAKRPTQKVRFVWYEGVDEKLKDIARGTLDQTCSEAQLTQFVDWVKQRTVPLFLARYQGVDVQLTDADGLTFTRSGW